MTQPQAEKPGSDLPGLPAQKAPTSEKQVFRKDGTKTYSLVELGRGPATMVEKGPDGTVFAFPVVALIELLLALGMNLALLVFALLKDAPLEEIANPLVTSDPAKAPWYFVGLQELLEHAHPVLAGVLIPTLLVLFLLAIPYIDNSRKGAGRWFTSPRGGRITLLAALYALVVMPAYILIDHAFPLRELLRGVLPELVANAVLPGLVLGLILLLPVLILRRWKPDARETLMLLFTLLFVSAIVFTLTGFLFRGPGFELYPPWDMPDGYNPLEHL